MTENHPIIFVGAGPGDPELITAKGQRPWPADLVLYAGSLVSPAVLGWANPKAELVDTAKLNLADICARLMAGYREPQTGGQGPLRRPCPVRRHPGAAGDPGTGKYSLPMIPGVSAAFAAAAALGQELTLPEVTQTVILTRAAGRTPVPREKPCTIWPGMGRPWSSIQHQAH